MKKSLSYIVLFVFLFIPTLVLGDTVPIEGSWTQGDLRSLPAVPFTIEKEKSALSVCSNNSIEEVCIRVMSVNGEVYFSEIYDFSRYESISISLVDLPVGKYLIEISHLNGHLWGRFINP